ncbi:MAG: ADP-ribosylglycohydrolase family protein [Clostridia bacterium]|nr:ADP-ribosylglycohydrolase family protein [Clostridia bacterium]
MSKFSYSTYLDKIYGCFLGKTVIGTLGAPYEGIKMPLELPFSPEMVNTMLPNDDLDLQVLWLDVAEKYGKNFTSDQLLDRFVNYCDYSPGEYAVMRKNYARGIHPPYSGAFSNDFYISGMGCPIRSEIWACLAPLNPELAADYATRDGVLDHWGDSVYGERFFAALESAAFGMDEESCDLYALIDVGLSVIPAACKFRDLVNDTVAWCRQYDDVKRILRKILHKYGHPDCTNLFQNIGITLAALLKGNLDEIKTGMDALNCGFDTDCTCATAGAVIGIIRGARSLQAEYGWGDVKFVLGVKSDRRSDSVFDFSEDVAILGKAWNPDLIAGGEVKDYGFEEPAPVSVWVEYPTFPDSRPDCSIALGETKTLQICLSAPALARETLTYTISGLCVVEEAGRIVLQEQEISRIHLNISVPADLPELPETNLYTFTYTVAGKDYTYTFGLVGATPWKAVGPIWHTDPPCTTEKLQKVPNYWHLMNPGYRYKGDSTDIVRRFHLNMAVDTTTPYLSEKELLKPLDPAADTKYEETLFSQREDSFRLDDIYGFSAPSVCYLVRGLVSPVDETVCVQMGHSAPFALYINGELICERDTCDTWDAENIHVQNIHIRKGVNTVILRLARVNADTKYNLIFSYGATCATHVTHYASVNPKFFRDFL